MITMLLGGLWHGAGWTIVIWGAVHGGGLAIERSFGLNRLRGVMRFAWFVATQLWVTLAWTFFRAPTPSKAGEFIGSTADFSRPGFALHPSIRLAAGFGFAVTLYQGFEWSVVRLPKRYMQVALGAATALAGLADLVVFSPPKVFIYFKF
jgi:alginate O-acetyltransferase complex protein AlgI